MSDSKQSDSGEFALIERMKRRWESIGVAGDMGDDAAILPLANNRVQVITVDMLVENRHFKAEWGSPEALGYKSVAVNLSDVAAMGATPQSIFVSLGLNDFYRHPERFDAFIAGVGEACRAFSCRVEGGDTTSSENHFVISVTAMGQASEYHIKKRSAATPGDVIAVTGTLGDAAGALNLLEQGLDTEFSRFSELAERLHRPVPAVREGEWLGQRPEVHAMMDLSDGLAGDIRHILTRSNCGAKLDLDVLPVSPALTEAANLLRKDARHIAVQGGDDYELLFTVDQAQWPEFKQAAEAKLARPVTRVGTILPEPGRLVFMDQEQETEADFQGYDHFK